MDRDFYQKLTLAVYRVTEFFPEKEPLRFQIRELADKILAHLILANPHPANILNKGDLLKDIKIIFGYFDLADLQHWVDPRNFAVLKKEYGKIQKPVEDASILNRLDQSSAEESVSPHTGKEDQTENAQRQDRIFDVINKNGMVKIGDLIKMFPGVNRRTVLRDLEKICQTGTVVKTGIGRGAHYTKNGHVSDINTTMSR